MNIDLVFDAEIWTAYDSDTKEILRPFISYEAAEYWAKRNEYKIVSVDEGSDDEEFDVDYYYR